jgi:hypothetical protein
MVQRRKPQGSRLRKLLVYIFVPLFVWLSGFVIWFYWYDLRALLTRPTDPTPQPKVTRPVDRTDKAERPPAKRPQEKIFDNERKKLDDIIKRQQ